MWARVEGHLGRANIEKQHTYHIVWNGVDFYQGKSLIYFLKTNDCGFPIHACKEMCFFYSVSLSLDNHILSAYHKCPKIARHWITSFYLFNNTKKCIIENGLKYKLVYAIFALSPILFFSLLIVYAQHSVRLALFWIALCKWMQMTKTWQQNKQWKSHSV